MNIVLGGKGTCFPTMSAPSRADTSKMQPKIYIMTRCLLAHQSNIIVRGVVVVFTEEIFFFILFIPCQLHQLIQHTWVYITIAGIIK